MAQSHWTFQNYAEHMGQMANMTRRWLEKNPDSVVIWLETHTIASALESNARRGNVMHFKDWRSVSRTEHFNRIASPLMAAAGAKVVPLADMSAPVHEASSDGAHPRDFLSREVIHMALAAACPDMP